MLSNTAINEFKRIYKDNFGVELLDKDAKIKANNLMYLIKIIYKPIKKDSIVDSHQKLTK